MSGPEESEPRPAHGEFHGRPTRRITNGSIWLDALAEGGPRIVRLGFGGTPENVLAETPEAGWETALGRFELVGGHRLWFAPEDPERVAVPDGTGLRLTGDEMSLRLEGPVEPGGLQRIVEVRLADGVAALAVRHTLRNASDRPVDLAPWAITQLPLGGTVVLPDQPALPTHAVRPNRHIVLWPYSSWSDERFVASDGRLVVEARGGRDFKVGYFNRAGWVGYARDRTMLVRRFRVTGPGSDGGRRYEGFDGSGTALGEAPGLRAGYPDQSAGYPDELAGYSGLLAGYPDLGCNVEVFVCGGFVELEVLGPLAALGPGAAVVHDERWELIAVAARSDPFALGIERGSPQPDGCRRPAAGACTR